MNDFDIEYKCECGERYLIPFEDDNQTTEFTCEECNKKVKLTSHIETYLTIKDI